MVRNDSPIGRSRPRGRSAAAGRVPGEDRSDRGRESYARSTDARQRSYQERIDALEREISDLEAELAEKDERLQSVIDRYEAILADQRRAYEARISEHDDQDGAAARLRRFLRAAPGPF